MPRYQVEFRTDAESAEHDVTGATPAHALAAARKLAVCKRGSLYFEPYDGHDIDEIVVTDDEGEPLCTWRSDELRLRYAAPALLRAAQEVVAAWERGDVAKAVRDLVVAIAEAAPNPEDDVPVRRARKPAKNHAP